MKISLIEPALKRLDDTYNYKLIEDLIKKSGDQNPDVIVLPEIFNTGEIDQFAIKIADKQGQKTKEILSILAKELNSYIIGGSVLDNRYGKVYNTSYVFDRDGKVIGSYDKTHLYSTSGEKDFITPGDSRLIFEIDGVKCGLLICYDIEFAPWVTSYALDDVEVLFNPACWHEDWIINYDSLIRARAIENQMFVVGVNSTGRAYEGHYGGHSQIVGPMANYIIDPNQPGPIKTAKLDISTAKEYKETFKILADRREDLYKKIYK